MEAQSGIQHSIIDQLTKIVSSQWQTLSTMSVRLNHSGKSHGKLNLQSITSNVMFNVFALFQNAVQKHPPGKVGNSVAILLQIH